MRDWLVLLPLLANRFTCGLVPAFTVQYGEMLRTTAYALTVHGYTTPSANT
jgi:hypothetical protein